jgi:ketosteroid isomerase-like protein
MSQENLDVLRSLFDAVARRDTATATKVYDPEVEWDNTRGPLQGLIERKADRAKGLPGIRGARELVARVPGALGERMG